MKPVKKFWCVFVVTLCLICLTSCVEFERQSMTYRYDSSKDELRIFQVYEGICAEGRDGKMTATEKRQLGDVILGQPTFFFMNWPLVYDRNQIQEILVTAKKRLADGDEVENGPSREVRFEMVKLMELALSSVKVTNGQFYLNNDKKLCAYQEVTVSNVSKLVAKLNQLGSLALSEAETGGENFTKEEWVQIKKFYETSKFIELDGNQLVIFFPLSRKDYFEGRKGIADAIRENRENDILADIVELDVMLNYREPILEIIVSSKDASQTSVELDTTSSMDGEYNTAVLDYVREHYTVEEELDVDGIRDAFLDD